MTSTASTPTPLVPLTPSTHTDRLQKIEVMPAPELTAPAPGTLAITGHAPNVRVSA